MRKTKEIIKYLNDNQYCIIVPVYYDHEEKPANRIEYIGSYKDCKKLFSNYPDYKKATPEENAQNRKYKMQEFLFLLEIGKTKKAQAIKAQYNF